ncbi:hypothetical protein GRF29_77g663178 [Pseudopithomyces chartarum]|uniref:Uncharacterized protein n=1 Tax=Pseudopithomyces chartarum TaxID=1892770 RepID=A0AAN6LVJ0_9PLEO|nr:hypothetical protein GRF29_77g663178 [Pseudopithomyces chartarum]
MRSTFTAAAVLASTASAQLYPDQSPYNHTCELQKPLLSCPPQDPSLVDSCCVETFGGLLLSTQFWSTYTGGESTGQLLPQDTWTLHGLWPDFCNGSYTQYCDLNRQYDPIPSPNTTTGKPDGVPVPAYNGSDIGTFLEPFGKYDLLEYMNNYWIAQNQDNAGFWATSSPSTPPATLHSTLLATVRSTRFPTFEWLKEADITPSNCTTYSYTDIRDTLVEKHGGLPFIGCTGPRYNTTEAGKNSTDNGYTVLSEAWYYEYVYGRPQEMNTIPVNASATYYTNCAKAAGAIHYPERTNGSTRVPTLPF